MIKDFIIKNKIKQALRKDRQLKTDCYAHWFDMLDLYAEYKDYKPNDPEFKQMMEKVRDKAIVVCGDNDGVPSELVLAELFLQKKAEKAWEKSKEARTKLECEFIQAFLKVREVVRFLSVPDWGMEEDEK